MFKYVSNFRNVLDSYKRFGLPAVCVQYDFLNAKNGIDFTKREVCEGTRNLKNARRRKRLGDEEFSATAKVLKEIRESLERKCFLQSAAFKGCRKRTTMCWQYSDVSNVCQALDGCEDITVKKSDGWEEIFKQYLPKAS